jgi:hypothetical protein
VAQPSEVTRSCAGAAERRDHHQQRHHGQVLEQQHAEHTATVFALELESLGHQLDDDGGRRHRHRAAQHQGALPRHAPGTAGQRLVAAHQHEVPDQRAEHRQHHLRQAESEDQRAHAAKLGQVELEPDDEHQEHHAELGQVAHAGVVLGQSQCIGADQHADHQVAQHRGQLQRAADDHAEHRGDQVQQSDFEGAGHSIPGARGAPRMADPSRPTSQPLALTTDAARALSLATDAALVT